MIRIAPCSVDVWLLRLTQPGQPQIGNRCKDSHCACSQISSGSTMSKRRLRQACSLHLDSGGAALDLAQVVRREFDGMPRRCSPPGGAASSCPESARSTASAPAAMPARSGPASRSSAPRRCRSRSTKARFALRASGVKRGTMLRKSELSNVVFSSILPGEEPCAQRAERHEADSEFLARRQHLLLGLAPPQRVLALNGGDGLHRMCAPNGLRAGLRQPEVPHLPLLDQLLHRAGDILDRHGRVDPVLIEEVDVRPSSAAAARPRPLLDVLRAAVQCRRAASPSGAMSKPNFVAITT